MKMKKIVGLVTTLFIAIVLVSCSQQALNEPTVSSASNTDVELLSEKRQKIIEEGHEVDGYRFRLMKMQYDEDALIEQMDTIIDNNFSMSKYQININNKLSLIPSGVTYDLSSNELGLNYFLINNSVDEISSVSIRGLTEFKNQTEALNFDIIVSKEQFTELKPKEFVAFSLTFTVPLDQYEIMKENKTDDFKLTITDLEVNGEKIDNNQ